MLRRLNFTGRRRLRRGDCEIEVARDPVAGLVFRARLALGGYGLPQDARVFVDAYRQMTLARYDFGVVAAIRPPEDVTLRAFGSGEAVRFRVRVVEAGADLFESPARVLAGVDNIRPRLAAEESRAESILPVEWGEFEDEVWRLDFEEGCEPILRVSRLLVRDRDAFLRSPAFTTLVMPGILRAVLTRILLVENAANAAEDEDWRSVWLGFAAALPGMPGGPPADRDEGEDWIDEAVSAFARRRGTAEQFSRWFDMEED